jgi:predicted O-methyltransferase YrrM
MSQVASKKATIAVDLADVERARRAYRDKMKMYIHAGNRYHNPAPELPNDHLKNCRFLENRIEILKLMPKNGIIAEVGVDRGVFSKSILDLSSPRRVHLIDIDLSRLDYDNVQDGVTSGKCILHSGDSSVVLQEFKDSYFDWIYIDGDHYYEGVKKDIQSAKSKIKPGGFLVFNDYSVWSPVSMTHCGVARAVNEFCLGEGWEIVYFCFQSMGYNDVAIRKM